MIRPLQVIVVQVLSLLWQVGLTIDIELFMWNIFKIYHTKYRYSEGLTEQANKVSTNPDTDFQTEWPMVASVLRLNSSMELCIIIHTKSRYHFKGELYWQNMCIVYWYIIFQERIFTKSAPLSHLVRTNCMTQYTLFLFLILMVLCITDKI